MNKNPFRANANGSVQQQNAEDWGSIKFKPTKFSSRDAGNSYGRGGRGGAGYRGGRGSRGGANQPFNKKFGNRNGNFPRKETSKFNQTDRDAKPENATPWKKFKDEIVFKQRDDEQLAHQANMDSEEGKKILKEREISYRKLLIDQKKQEPTQWDDFGEEANNAENKKNKNHAVAQEEHIFNGDSKFKLIKNKKSHQNTNDTKSKQIFKKKNNSNVVNKAAAKELISKELLDNFDSKKLSFEQNDKIRSILTKTTNMVYGSTLKQSVNNMKRKKDKITKK